MKGGFEKMDEFWKYVRDGIGTAVAGRGGGLERSLTCLDERESVLHGRQTESSQAPLLKLKLQWFFRLHLWGELQVGLREGRLLGRPGGKPSLTAAAATAVYNQKESLIGKDTDGCEQRFKK